MKFHIGRWALIAILAAGTNARAEQRALGTSAKGLAIWFGNVIEPPITVSVRFRMAGTDTIYEQIYVNALPTIPEPRKATATVPTSLSRVQLLAAAASDSTPLSAFQALSRAEKMSTIARIYSRRTDLVDSCRVLSDEVVRAYWKGGGHEDFVWSHFPTPSLAERTRQIRQTAEYYIAMLRRDSAILFGAGEIIVPPSHRAQLMREIQDLRAGRNPTARVAIVKSPALQAYLRRPEPLRPREN